MTKFFALVLMVSVLAAPAWATEAEQKMAAPEISADAVQATPADPAAATRQLADIFSDCAAMLEVTAELQRDEIKDVKTAETVQASANDAKTVALHYATGADGQKYVDDRIAAKKPEMKALILDQSDEATQSLSEQSTKCALMDETKQRVLRALKAPTGAEEPKAE